MKDTGFFNQSLVGNLSLGKMYTNIDCRCLLTAACSLTVHFHFASYNGYNRPAQHPSPPPLFKFIVQTGAGARTLSDLYA